jgi:exodeoxyribonuclease V alpha subunit
MNPLWKGPNKAIIRLGRIIFAGDNGFVIACAALIAPHEDPDIKITGKLPQAEEGRTYSVVAEWEHKPQYHTWQLKVSSAMCIEPTTLPEIERFLGGLEGIGPKARKSLTEKYGLEAIKTIGAQGIQAFRAAGITPALAKKAHLDFTKKQQAWSTSNKILSAAGIPESLHGDIIGRYGDSLDVKMREDPLAIFGFSKITFSAADRLWACCGVPHDDSRRIIAGMRAVLECDSQKGGHCWMPTEEAVKKAAELLKLENMKVPPAEDVYVFDEDGCAWLTPLLDAEVCVSKRLAKLLSHPGNITKETLWDFENVVAGVINDGNRELSENYEDCKISAEQEAALRGIPGSRVSILTGSAGTGKTSTVKWLVEIYARLGIKSVFICAPTAAAARRASNVLRGAVPAMTVHRLLGQRLYEGGHPPVSADVIIVDESSMLDIKLTAHLLCAVKNSAHVVFVGDPFQLPSVGPGAVLRDLIDSEIVPHFNLGRNAKRQGSESGILRLAYAILDGHELPLRTIDGRPCFSDVTHFLGTNHETITRCSLDIWGEHQRDWKKIKFITQQWGNKKKDEPADSKLGVNLINKELTRTAGFSGPSYTAAGQSFYAGMYCIWRENVYGEDNIYMVNGQPFIIEELNMESKLMTISTDDTPAAEYIIDLNKYKSPESFIPGYCSTIHSAQGNEYDNLAYIVQPSDYLTRECIYTALTRAKKKLIIIGNIRPLWRAQFETNRRRTGLVQRIQDT